MFLPSCVQYRCTPIWVKKALASFVALQELPGVKKAAPS